MTTALSIYFALNVFLAIGMHVATLRSTLERPKPIELTLYFFVFLLFGIPAIFVAILVGAFSMMKKSKPEEQQVYAMPAVARPSGIHIAHR